MCLFAASTAGAQKPTPPRAQPPGGAASAAEQPATTPERSARLAYGQDGAIWLAFRLEPDAKKARPALAVQIINEGAGKFSLTPGDSWVGVTSTGSRVPMKPRAAMSGSVDPKQSMNLSLVSTRKATGADIVALFYRSEALGREVEVRDPTEVPEPTATVAVRFDPAIAPQGISYAIGYIAVVGADGRVESVVDAPKTGADRIAFLDEAAHDALRQWKFEPVTQDGVARRSLFRTTLVFSGESKVVRAVFPVAPEEFIPRLQARMREASFAAVAVPKVSGFASVGYPAASAADTTVTAFLVRTGPEPGGPGTWVAARAVTLAQYSGPLSPVVWRPPLVSSGQFLSWVSRELGVVPATRQGLSDSPYAMVPSGALEPVDVSWFNLRAVEKLMRLSFDAGSDAQEKGKRVEASDPRLPNESELIERDGWTVDPETAAARVVAPILLEKVEPVYPAMARAAKIAGPVVLRIVIDTEGRPGDVAVLRSPHPSLTEAARQALLRWKWTPATFEGRYVRCYATVVVQFSLD